MSRWHQLPHDPTSLLDRGPYRPPNLGIVSSSLHPLYKPSLQTCPRGVGKNTGLFRLGEGQQKEAPGPMGNSLQHRSRGILVARRPSFRRLGPAAPRTSDVGRPTRPDTAGLPQRLNSRPAQQSVFLAHVIRWPSPTTWVPKGPCA